MNAGCIFIDVTVSSPDPVVLIVSISAAKLNRSAKSDGLIGAAPILIKTSSSEGTGIYDVAIESSTLPSLVTIDLISFECCSDMFSPYFKNFIIYVLR
jgi:hypothetical protein